MKQEQLIGTVKIRMAFKQMAIEMFMVIQCFMDIIEWYLYLRYQASVLYCNRMSVLSKRSAHIRKTFFGCQDMIGCYQFEKLILIMKFHEDMKCHNYSLLRFAWWKVVGKTASVCPCTCTVYMYVQIHVHCMLTFCESRYAFSWWRSEHTDRNVEL